MADRCGFLPTEGFDVEVAESGQAGLALARSNWPELIVLDKKLPDLDGIEVLLLDWSVGVPAFMACVHIFRTACPARDRVLGTGVYDEMRQRIRRVLYPLEELNSKVAGVVARVEGAGRNALHVKEGEVAHECGVDPAHLGRLVKRQTGIGFREWRWGVAMRLAVRALADTDDQVKYVAAESGFATKTGSTAGFERSFHRLFGMAPGEFRRLVRHLPSSSA